eukprot:COSAG06_NODE_10589_length_1653_cov_0.853925_2_plen_165_part_01
MDSTDDEVSLACGATCMCGNLLNYIPAALAERETATALFCSSAALLHRVCPSPLPAQYWISTCAEVDVTSARLVLSLEALHLAALLDQSVLESASWLDQVLAMAVHICKINASAELSARPTMAAIPFIFSFRVVEAAATVESHKMSLLESGVVEALDYGCANEFN